MDSANDVGATGAVKVPVNDAAVIVPLALILPEAGNMI